MADHAQTETAALRVQFDTEAQQRNASALGMWIFLITEIMFFGGMFAVYTVYRSWYPDVFAIASSSLNEIIGALNTGVLPEDQGHAQLFFSIYFAMTGLHALHMVIGVAILLTLIVLARKGRFSASYYTPVDVAGLYWHFVDIIWIFLFPLLYLIDRHLVK